MRTICIDENNPTKMVFIGREVDKVVKNLTVTDSICRRCKGRTSKK